MNVRDLIPWNRNNDRGMVTTTGREGFSPLFNLQRDMNRVFEDFFRGFDRGFETPCSADGAGPRSTWPRRTPSTG